MAIINNYEPHRRDGAKVAFAINPHDSTPLLTVTEAIYVGVAGNIAVRAVHSDTDAIYLNVPAGSYITVCASHVRATGTTATGLIGEV